MMPIRLEHVDDNTHPRSYKKPEIKFEILSKNQIRAQVGELGFRIKGHLATATSTGREVIFEYTVSGDSGVEFQFRMTHKALDEMGLPV
jgi:hypothetical protein